MNEVITVRMLECMEQMAHALQKIAEYHGAPDAPTDPEIAKCIEAHAAEKRRRAQELGHLSDIRGLIEHGHSKRNIEEAIPLLRQLANMLEDEINPPLVCAECNNDDCIVDGKLKLCHACAVRLGKDVGRGRWVKE